MTPKGKKVPKFFSIKLEHVHHVVLCNDKPLLTPAGNPYALPTEALAEAVAAEWRVQEDKLDTTTMPFTRLAATAIDLVAAKREKTIGKCLAYSATDLLCHREGDGSELAKRQQEIWQPYLDWAAMRFGSLFRVGTGVMPIEQPADVVTGIEEAVAPFSVFHLMGLQEAIDNSGSLILGLALALGEKSAAEIFYAAELEALVQIDSWGEDPVTQARLAAVKRDLEICERWFTLLQAPSA